MLTIGWAIACIIIAIGFIVFVKRLMNKSNEPRWGCWTLILYVFLLCLCGLGPCAFGREDLGWCLIFFAIITWTATDRVWTMAFGEYSIHYGADPP